MSLSIPFRRSGRILPVVSLLAVAAWMAVPGAEPAKNLLRDLEAERPGVRAATILRMTKMGPLARDAAPGLGRLLDDDNVVIIVSKGGGGGRRVIEVPWQGSPEKTWLFGLQLMMSGSSGENPHLATIADLAEECLVKIGARAIDALADVVRSREALAVARIRAASALASIGQPRGLASLTSALEDPEPHVCLAAAEAAWILGGEVPMKRIEETLASADASVRKHAVGALAKSRGVGAADVLFRVFRMDLEPNVRAEALRSLVELGDSRSSAVLIEGLKDPAWSVCQPASEMLVDRGDASVIEAMLEILDGSAPLARDRAAFVLRSLSGKALGRESAPWRAWWSDAKDRWKPPRSPRDPLGPWGNSVPRRWFGEPSPAPTACRAGEKETTRPA